MSQVILTNKNQITLPKTILKELGIKSGSKLLLRIRSLKGSIVIEPKPKSLSKHYRGLGKKTWQKLGGGEKFLNQERKLWQ